MAADAGTRPPLFPISPPEAFPDARQAFDQTRQLILEKYYSPQINEESLYWAATRGMLRHISPPKWPELGALWSDREYQGILDSLLGLQSSLGIHSQFNASDGSLTVSRVLPDSPADGRLQTHDRIMRINGETLRGRPVQEIERLLRAPSGKITVVRDLEVFQVTLQPRQFELPSLRQRDLPDGIGYIGIPRITRDIATTLATALKPLREVGTRKLILDLRNNGGGVFIEGLRLAELFLPANSVLLRTLRRPDAVQNYISSNPNPHDFMLTVLVNAQTGSAAEAMAAALKAHARATVVGSRTYGKAIMEETFRLDNGYRVKFIVGAMYDPAGKSWQGRGIVPDLEVPLDAKRLDGLWALADDLALQQDWQLKTAWRYLRDKAVAAR